MKTRILSILLAIVVLLGISLRGLPAQAEENHFSMSADVSTQEGVLPSEAFTVRVTGQLLPDAQGSIGGFQFTLDYPRELVELLSLELAPGLPSGLSGINLESGSVAYNVNGGPSIPLPPDDSVALAIAEFRVLPEAAGAFSVSLTEGEIIRPEDEKSTLGAVYPTGDIPILSMLTLPETASAAGNLVAPTLCKNPAGTLVAAVYGPLGQMLNCCIADAPEDAGTMDIPMDLTGGAWVCAFLLDAGGCPLCPAARMTLY